MRVPESRTSWKRSMICGIRRPYCALTSTRGTGTASQSRSPAVDQPGDTDDHRCNHQIFRVRKVMVEALVARPQRPARRRDPEAPRDAAEEGQHGESDDRHPHDARGDRDERTDDRDQPAEEDRGVAEAVEPAVGPVELLAVEVEPAP